MSGRPGEKRFSKEGFRPLENTTSATMVNPNDATIDIPLTTVNSRGQTGARKADATLSPPGYFPPTELPQESHNEKSGLFQRHIAGRRKKRSDVGVGARPKRGDDEEGKLTTMGTIYNWILNFSVITRYFVYVLPLALLIAVPIVIGATVAKKARIGGVRIMWLFTWVEIVWLSLWISKIVAQMLPAVFQFLCGIVSSGTRKYALVIKALEIPLSLVGWALASLATFKPLMAQEPGKGASTDWQDIIRSILLAALFSTLILLAEKILVQLISISYHRKQFDQKIKTSKHNIYLLSLLYDASRTLFPAYCPEFAAEDYVIHDSIELGSKQGSGQVGSGSATPMRFIQNIGRVGDKVTAAFGSVAHEITGKQVFNPTAAHSIVVEALEKTKSSEALARRLWMSFVVEGKDALYQEDITEVLGAGRQVEAEECFASLDRDGNGDISLDEMILTVCEFGRERHSIANSMHDVDQAINVLDNLLCTIAFVMVVFVFVAFLNKNLTTTLATTGTALLSLSFVFAATAQEVLGSCIFLFVKHPFDVGDRVDITDSQLTVERISLLFTVFRKVKDHKTTQVPNIVLNSNWIDNITRSNAMREQISLYINFDTTLEDIQLLKNEMHAFVLDKDNSRDFQPDVDIEVTGIAEMNKLELKVEIRHKSNWANEAVRAGRRSKFMCALVLALRRVPIYGPGAGDAALGGPSNPTYSVSVSDAQASKSRSEFSETKEKKRMTATKSTPSKQAAASPSTVTNFLSKPFTSAYQPRSYDYNTRPSTATASETTVVETLNSRQPALDPARDNDTEYYRSTSPAGDGDSPPDTAAGRRSNDIEEVRGLLRRKSSKGMRKQGPSAGVGAFASAGGAALPPAVPTIAEPKQTAPPPPRSDSKPKVEFHDYANTSQSPVMRPAGAATSSSSPMSRSSSYGSNNPYARAATTATPVVAPPPLQVQPRRSVQGQGQGQQQGNAFAQQLQNRS